MKGVLDAARRPVARQREFFGRRKGRRLRPHQQTLIETKLPDLVIDRMELEQLSQSGQKIWLEIGFGSGEHLLWQAQNNPDTNCIGCEVYLNGIAKLIAGIEERSITNIRLWNDDARLLLADLPEASIDRIFILFPDPWPKVRHRKRRMLSPQTLSDIAAVLRPGGILRAATDIPDYQFWILHSVLVSEKFHWLASGPSDWRDRLEDWPQTRYEKKAISANRTCAYFSFVRKG